MHEHIARAMYYFSIHILFASIGGGAAWVLTSIRGASATTKYWIWVVTAFNFVVPAGALIDKVWAPHLTWAHPLGAIGGPVWDMTEGWTAVVLALIWIAGAFAMLMRLISRIRTERREQRATAKLSDRHVASSFMADGIPVSFDSRHSGPAVSGIFSPHIFLPLGIDRVLDQPEFDAVLLHELAHARRRDNLIRLLFEVSLCALWFHPLVWIAGARMALYRELSCDESVIRRAQGRALVSALAKLAVPESAVLLRATASSHLGDRLARLAEPPQVPRRIAGLIQASLFVAVITACIFQTIAHTACCFLLKR
ncbi:MAG TPA: M56 family metallopeptidase [Candidatus Sulfotelmatobacter sp.]|nr:M56 family metallopeptidase [Candidatus Sulfotelmatobacter sp.]